jgi:molybdate-binding protein/DNA-binding transcriptional regulator YhcF (GntR family)
MHTIHNIDINLQQGEAIYLQIANHIKRQIATGDFQQGSCLPAIRSLAAQLDIDPGTVARAYRELEKDGILLSRPGRGTVISSKIIEKSIIQEQHKRLSLVVEKAILESLGLGFTVEEIMAAFIARLGEWRERRTLTDMERDTVAARQSKEVHFAGSHDLAVELIESHMGILYPDQRFSATFVGSFPGLVALAGRSVDIAGSHLLDSESGQFNIPFIRRLMPNENVILINLIQRFQGLILAPGNPKSINSIQDLTRPDVTIVNRQNGSGTRILFDSRLLDLGIEPTRITGYDHEEKTHTAVASLISQGRADVGLGAESAAIVLGLNFIPLLKERYDLVVLADTFEKPKLRKLHEVVCSKSFLSMMRSMPGYDVSDTGKIQIIGPDSMAIYQSN